MNPRQSIDPSHCPLCGRANDCQLCTTSAYKGPCWCMQVEMPEALLARVPPELRNKACICRSCVSEFKGRIAAQAGHTVKPEALSALPPILMPGDYYFEQGLMVFTAAYLLRRGYCCHNNCRHCPYAGKNPVRAAV